MPSKWKCLPVWRSISSSGPGPPCPSPTRLAATFGLTRIRNASGSGRSDRDLPQPALRLDRHGLLGQHHALAFAGRAGLREDLAHAVGHVLARHLDQAKRRDLDDVGLGAVLVERLAQRLQHRVAVARPGHVDEVDDDDPADVAQPQLANDLVGRLEVRLGDRVLELGALAAAGERARVDVDHRHRLGVVDHQVAAGGQVHAPAQHRLDRVLDAVALEQRLLVRVQLEALEQLRARCG